MKIFIYLFMSFFSFHLFANVKYSDELSSYIGMSMVNYTENPKSISGENVADPASGTVTAISAAFQYNFKADYKKNYYITTSFPLLPNPQLYINAAFGMEYYFNDVASKTHLFSSGTSLSIKPTFRYFVGGEIGAGYLVYTALNATKSDVLFEFGPVGGFGYTFSENWAAKLKLSVLRGTGVVSSTMNINALFGVTRFLD